MGKIDQNKSIGTPDFLYNSLHYNGSPSEKDSDHANFILQLSDLEESRDTLLGAENIVIRLESFAQADTVISIRLNWMTA